LGTGGKASKRSLSKREDPEDVLAEKEVPEGGGSREKEGKSLSSGKFRTGSDEWDERERIFGEDPFSCDIVLVLEGLKWLLSCEPSTRVDLVFADLFMSRSANDVALESGFFLGGVDHPKPELEPSPMLPSRWLVDDNPPVDSSEDMLGLEREFDSERIVLVLVLANDLILLDNFRDREFLGSVEGMNPCSPSSPTLLTVGIG